MRVTKKLSLVLALFSTSAFSANLFVPDQYPTIQAAVDAASAGDRILVSSGNFAGARIDKWVKITGEGDATVITDGIPGGAFSMGFQLISGADKTQISDLTIALEGPAGSSLTGIEVSLFAGPAPSMCMVRDVRFVGLTRGIRVRDSTGWIITNNSVEGLSASTAGLLAAGIWMSGSGDSLIANNTIVHDGAGTPGKIYVGINLSASPGTGPVDSNKIVNNLVSVHAPGALKASDIELFQTPFECDDNLFIVDNKVINNQVSTLLLTPTCLAEYNIVH